MRFNVWNISSTIMVGFANSARMISRGVDALVCIICANFMTSERSICVYMYMGRLGALGLCRRDCLGTVSKSLPKSTKHPYYHFFYNFSWS